MGRLKRLFLIVTLTSLFYAGDGCQMEGVTNWFLTISETILDTHEGVFFSRSISNIDEIISVNSGDGLNAAQYLDINLDGPYFTISTNAAFAQYEENETAESMSFTVNFRCSSGSTNLLIFQIQITDTNNNAPIFKSEGSHYELTITPPIPPNFQITGCFDDNIVVRDIDLTTERIDFQIEENPYFEIVYDGRSSSDSKEFVAVIRTKDLIRNFPEALQLEIFATDVDRTGDPPITTTGTIRVQANDDFQFPEELVFSQPFYTATYSNDQLTGLELISLQQGYHENVFFSLEGEHSSYFNLQRNENQISVSVSTPLPRELLNAGQLILVVRAEREHTSGATATVIVQLPGVLGLEFELLQYQGQIIDNELQPLQLSLTQGYEDGGVNITLLGDYASFFFANLQGNVVTLTMTTLDAETIEDNFVSLQVRALNEFSSTTAVVTLDIIKDDNVTPVFENAIYMGEYDPDTGLALESIMLVQGYDDTVSFSLVGDYSNYFQLSSDGPNIAVTSSSIPSEIWAERQLYLIIEARKPRTVNSVAVISISMPPEKKLAFEEFVYTGTLQNDSLTIVPILLNVGYSDDIVFNISGQHANLFTISNEQNQVSINLLDSLPEDVGLENNFLTLTLSASGVHAISTSTIVLLEIIKEDVTTPVFSENIYRAIYFGNNTIESPNISLKQGYDSSVTFRLDGEYAQYFGFNRDGNNLNLFPISNIPPEIIFREKVLVFNVLADKPLSVGANSAVSISFPQEYTDPTVIRFLQNTYVGSLDNNDLSLENLFLESEFDSDAVVLITGEFASYFEVSSYTANGIQINLRNELPAEVINQHAFVILDIEASYPGAISGFTSVVIEITKEHQILTPVFEQSYYAGEYTEQGLQFDQSIRLIQGFDETVLFTLAGDDAEWFELVQIDESTLSLAVTTGTLGQIRDRSHLVFSIVATKPQSVAGRAAIIINLPAQQYLPLQFAQNFYLGTINGGHLSLSDIYLEDGLSSDINITLAGDHANFFEIRNQGNGVFSLHILSEIPADILDANNVLVFTIEARVEDSKAHTTVILEVIKAGVSQPVFEEAYYTGSYSLIGGFIFDPQITLIEGFDETVLFSLEGDNSEWFGMNINQNSISLEQTNPIPIEVISNNKKLVFIIVAQKPGNAIARSTIIISIIDDTPVLEFERTVYLGEIQNNITSIETIVLNQGYSENVTFNLIGELSSYFSVESEGAVVQISLQSAISDELLPNSGIVLLELQASAPQAISAYATLIFGVITNNIESKLEFSETYYTGIYNEVDGLAFENIITLVEGYAENVDFTLDGDNSQYFDIDVNGNSISLRVSTTIPPPIVMNNHVLIFTISADKPGTAPAKAVIVISLLDEYIEGPVLGFDKISYVGSIENGTSYLEPIVLSAGFTQNVSFTLHGDLSTYFNLRNEGDTVYINLQTTIPEQVMPESGIIILELQASAPDTMSAFAVIVFKVVIQNDPPNQEQLVFSETYYTGHYTETEGLLFENIISLVEGYDESVVFELEGENSQYFEIEASGNLVTLRIAVSIPPPILQNNQQLVFIVRADKPHTPSARATIVILLLDEYTDNRILGFERITYIGTINNQTINLDPIVLVEGYTDNVTFTLHGELSNYFNLSNTENTVEIYLEGLIPEQIILDSGVIVLELQATEPESLSAYAAIVLEVTRDIPPTVEQLVFGEIYYTGQYTEREGLVFEEVITLAEGYDEDVQFNLDGDNAQYFEAVISGNSVTLRIATPIPPAIVTNNHNLLFVIQAEKPTAFTAKATIIIALREEFEDNQALLGFDRISYQGSIENFTVNLDTITLTEGFNSNVSFTLHGELSSYFRLSSEGPTVSIALNSLTPEELLLDKEVIVLELQASAPEAISAYAVIILGVSRENSSLELEQLIFGETYYTGKYTEAEGLVFEESLVLSEGYDDDVQFILEGEDSQYFETVIDGNSVSLRIIVPIPSAVVRNTHQLVFVIRADKPAAVTARATIVISLIDDLSNYFMATSDEAIVTIILQSPIPDESLPNNGIIVLELQASAPNSSSTYATIVIEVLQANVVLEQLLFSETYYTGYYIELEGLSFDIITLVEGYDENVRFTLEGDNSQYFEAVVSSNTVTLELSTPIPGAVNLNNLYLIFTIHADKPNAIPARATIVIALRDEQTTSDMLGFHQINYLGTIESNVLNVESITLSVGYSGSVTFTLLGGLSQYFTVSSEGTSIIITMSTIPEQDIPANRIIVLNLQASAPETISAFATIVLEVIEQEIEDISFVSPYFIGQYADGNVDLEETIALSQGFDENVQFSLEGEYSQWFQLEVYENTVSILLNATLPSEILENRSKLVFVIAAQKPGATTVRATIVISLGSEDVSGARFEKILFEGLLQGEEVSHESITVTGFDGTNIQLLGEYAGLFIASVSNGAVAVERTGSVTLPDSVSYVALELQAGTASAVLILDVIPAENPVVPTVTFSSPSYILRIDISQTGLAGRVQATADNGENIAYSLDIDNEHLLQRVSINEEGEIHISAPANTGVYSFNVVATTVFTQVTAYAEVHLSVEAVPSCGEDSPELPPLIILDRDEESPHQNLVVLDQTKFEGCSYQLNNGWPVDQTWLYVDENGLHTTAIDREHESIAFMALSQVQVELILVCDNDTATRAKHSVASASRLDHLGPYDYGDNKWILTDSITFNPRRTLVNLIVNDINDNAPIFIGKESEPITVGYPVPDLERMILPRAIAKVEATDADVGENAALVYWSREDILAVSPSTGFIHIRNNAQLENNTILTIYATDRNGQGLDGSLDLLVKLIDTNHIAVVTIQDAFLEDEDSILSNLSNAIGYEVKSLRSTVISNDLASGFSETRIKRDAELSTGASLQLYVYGLIQQEPVSVEQLTDNINSGDVGSVIVASSVSLGDYLESLEICPLPGRDTGLFVATITLSVLLFILIVAAAVWFFLTWRKKQNYEQFSDENSLASRNESLAPPITPVQKPESVPKPRINIEELKRSERRLQEMLEAPVEDIAVAPPTAQKVSEAKVYIPEAPIVIQSIDKLKDGDDSEDEDEFGERLKAKRKSVVTFNENVEKIIHVEDPPDDPEMEVYKL